MTDLLLERIAIALERLANHFTGQLIVSSSTTFPGYAKQAMPPGRDACEPVTWSDSSKEPTGCASSLEPVEERSGE